MFRSIIPWGITNWTTIITAAEKVSHRPFPSMKRCGRKRTGILSRIRKIFIFRWKWKILSCSFSPITPQKTDPGSPLTSFCRRKQNPILTQKKSGRLSGMNLPKRKNRSSPSPIVPIREETDPVNFWNSSCRFRKISVRISTDTPISEITIGQANTCTVKLPVWNINSSCSSIFPRWIISAAPRSAVRSSIITETGNMQSFSAII